MNSDLWKSVNYKTNMKYCIDKSIREYDLSKANINSLLYMKAIDKDMYINLYNSPKEERERTIGIMIQKDSSIYKVIQKGIIEAKKRLFEANDIQDYEVVDIKNDAVFIAGRSLNITNVGDGFDFVLKNKYDIYMQLLDLELFYSEHYDSFGNVTADIDIKGLSKDNILLHSNGICSLLIDICNRILHDPINHTVEYLSKFYNDFINRTLDVEYYRSFDYISGYIFRTRINEYSLPYITQDNLKYVNIDRNLSLLRDLLFVVTDIFRRRNK